MGLEPWLTAMFARTGGARGCCGADLSRLSIATVLLYVQHRDMTQAQALVLQARLPKINTSNSRLLLPQRISNRPETPTALAPVPDGVQVWWVTR